MVAIVTFTVDVTEPDYVESMHCTVHRWATDNFLRSQSQSILVVSFIADWVFAHRAIIHLFQLNFYLLIGFVSVCLMQNFANLTPHMRRKTTVEPD